MAKAPLKYKVNYNQRLPLDRCPWCKAAKPSLMAVNVEAPIKYCTFKYLCWATYRCSSCQNMILAHFGYNHNVSSIPEILQDDRVVENSLSFFPSDDTKLDNSISTEIADLITEAMEIRQAPRSCGVACGNAVDAMLEINQIKKGSLN